MGVTGLVGVMALVGLAGLGEPAEPSLGFRLQDHRGAWHTLDEARGREVVVLAFLGVECPLAEAYAPRLAQVARDFEKRGVGFFGVDANTTATLLCGDVFTGVLALGTTLDIAEGAIELELKLDPSTRACFVNLCWCWCCWCCG